MKRIFKVLSSVKLFLALLVVIVVLAAIATFIPQGLEATAYHDRYPSLFATVATALGVTDFFHSPLFFGLLALVELNLILCTMPRLWRRVVSISRDRAGRPHSGGLSQLAVLFGPDIIHLGLIITIGGGLLISVTRDEQRFLVPVGAEVQVGETIPPITVVDSREIRSDSGMVIDWQIDLRHAGREQTVALNHPIEIAGYRVHFFHWGEEPVMILRDSGGVEYGVRVGEGLVGPDGNARVFAGLVDTDTLREPGSARIQVISPDGVITGEGILNRGEQLGQYTYARADTQVLNGFTVTSDRGRTLVFIGFFFILGGLGIYSYGTWRKHG